MSNDLDGLRLALTSKPTEPYIDDEEAVQFDVRIMDWFGQKAFSGDRIGVLGGGATKNARGVEKLNGIKSQSKDPNRQLVFMVFRTQWREND